MDGTLKGKRKTGIRAIAPATTGRLGHAKAS